MIIYNLVILLLVATNLYGYTTTELVGIGSVIPAYGKNINFLNNCNHNIDKTFEICYYMDIFGKYITGYDKECPMLEAKLLLKSQGTFTHNQFIVPFPTDRGLKFYETLLDNHLHILERPLFWINEIWIKLNISNMLCLPLEGCHTLTLGLFPFILGRGIALGFNNPDYQQRFFLLVPTFSIVNQYPPGILLSGPLSKTVAYDIYGSTVDNKAARMEQTALITKADIYGHNRCGARGFGAVHYYIATRLRWDPVTCKEKAAHMELYTVFNNNPLINNPFSNERPPFIISNMGSENIFARITSLGGAGEYKTGKWEFGFDTAKNFGYAQFLGSDTNMLTLRTNSSFVEVVNNKVNLIANNEPAPATFENQLIINSSPENQAQNGKPISRTLKNDITRFRDSFTILMRGWMFIADAQYKLDEQWKAAATLGISSGGPIISQLGNDIIVNNNFIGLQELYVGKRVVNAFFLNGSYAGPRPIDFPNALQASDADFTRDGFTDMIFTGVAARYTTKLKQKYELEVNPNLLWYWSQYAATNFAVNPIEKVPRFYGTEFNIFATLAMNKHLKWVGVFLLFLPGTFYQAIANQPITTDQFDYVADLQAGRPTNFVPLIGADPGYVLNIGLELSF